jgi:4a-hydroxytetrahydrobiopterin dehydratase
VWPLSSEQAREHLAAAAALKLSDDGSESAVSGVKDFVTALDFFNRVGRIAEEEDHHPDLHLTGYRQVAIEIGTHAIDALRRTTSSWRRK